MKRRNVKDNVENQINGSTRASTPTINKKIIGVGVDALIDPLKNRGITLIALIITIILMLILAGVVISLALGEKGLINIAKYTVQKNNETSSREKLEILFLNMQAEKEININYNKDKYLTSKIEEQNMTIIDEDIVLVNGWMFRDR